MSQELLERPMADDKPKTLSVKLPVDVIESARIVAAFRNDTMGDLLAEILRPVLSKMERAEMTKRTAVDNPRRKAGEK